MTDPELTAECILDAAIAREVMGWRTYELTRFNGTKFRQFLSPGSAAYISKKFISHGYEGMVEVDSGDEQSAPSFSTNLNTCREAELEIIRKGSHELSCYVAELCRAVGTIDQARLLIYADAKTRCNAMLKALRGLNDQKERSRTVLS